MAKITQYSRISHHTITGSSSATFSVPTSEDFTDGTWTVADLALSEIGVNEDGKTAFIRIGDEIKEFSFNPGLIGPTGPAGPTGGSQSLADVLLVGNNTGGTDIIMWDRLYSYDGNSYIEFNKGSDGIINLVSNSLTTPYLKNTYLQNGDEITQSTRVGLTNSTILMNETEWKLSLDDNTDIETYQSVHNGLYKVSVKDPVYDEETSFTITNNSAELKYYTDNDGWYSKLNIDGTSPQISLSTGYTNGALISRFASNGGSLDSYVGNNTSTGTYSSVSHNDTTWRVLKVDNDVEVADLRVDSDLAGNFRVGVNKTNFGFGTVSTVSSASASVFTLSLPNAGDHSWVKAQVKAISSTFSKSYVADIFGGFRNDGSLNLVGTGYSVIEYTDFSGARADYDISGTDMIIRVYGETSSTINWSVNVTWG